MAGTPKLDLAPFPPLEWFRGWWGCSTVLTTWRGFRCRWGASGAVGSPDSSDGTAQLRIEPPERRKSPPSPEQGVAYNFLVEQEKRVTDSILWAVFDYCQFMRAPETTDDWDLMPVVSRPGDLRGLIGVAWVFVLSVTRYDCAYVGFEFGCEWDDQGLGVLLYRDRVVGVGYADTAFNGRLAEKDRNGTLYGQKDR